MCEQLALSEGEFAPHNSTLRGFCKGETWLPRRSRRSPLPGLFWGGKGGHIHTYTHTASGPARGCIWLCLGWGAAGGGWPSAPLSVPSFARTGSCQRRWAAPTPAHPPAGLCAPPRLSPSLPNRRQGKLFAPLPGAAASRGSRDRLCHGLHHGLGSLCAGSGGC